MEEILRKVIRRTLLEASFTTAGGDSVEYGSPEHISDLEASLAELVRVRNRQPRTSKSRYIYARAVEETRKQLKSARRYGIKHGLLEDQG